MSWDSVVIGSGPEGLTAGAALARAGHRVLVLEERDVPWCTARAFTMNDRSADPAAHIVGDLHEGGGLRRIFEGLGVGPELSFCELNPDGFDRLLIGEERFDHPRGLTRWQERLAARFPGERAGLTRYFELLGRIHEERERCASLRGPELLKAPWMAPTLLRWGLLPLGALLERCVRDPLLRAALSARAPAGAPLALHAAMAAHHAQGRYYPRGGAARIAQALIRIIRRRGGEVRAQTRVTRLLLDRNRAVGVETNLGERIHARRVVCDAALVRQLGRTPPAAPARDPAPRRHALRPVRVTCTVDLDLRSMGFDSGNVWWYRDRDAALSGGTTHDLDRADIQHLFVSVTTLKDPAHRRDGLHAVELVTRLPATLVTRWGHDLGARMLATAERLLPGVHRAARLPQVEIGAPLSLPDARVTVRSALQSATEALLEGVPFPGPPPVERLSTYRTGAFSHGLAGAIRAGLVAAQRALGLERPEDCLGAPTGTLRVYPADRPEEWLPSTDETRDPTPPRRLRQAA
ncbi:phytoene desaturase family protein [Chondromyces crocatus]|uniref:Amine oxidase domain-containing protein n=1 Tax=Chondromyces crocatus TaxID=52 RepID=A0A0K1E521_CHOCO|nr:NAD(P)/FAD-dependent oxidoreductase [Chondromyces crocatus]AKT35949.1 uncharacterized protein CMC5_000610 [Chondromyces crocatus]